MKPILRVLIKALLLYLALNLLVALVGDLPAGGWTVYNRLVPGRQRLPFGETPREAYNFSLFDVDAMLASHIIVRPKAADEYRVIVIGDSSMWGTLLRPEETLAGQLDAMHLRASDGRQMRFYNLGYPTISVTKDLLILDAALKYEPDLVVWAVTLEAFPIDKQLDVPLVQNNPVRARALIERYQLPLPVDTLQPTSFWERTLIGRRKAIADGLRLQLYGLMWAATGIDQTYPTDYPRAQVDLEADPLFHGQPDVTADDLALDVLSAAQQKIDVPLLIVNEPILISTGANSELRYNFYYPRLAYDSYRVILEQGMRDGSNAYIDAWNIVPAGEFTNSAIHLDRHGTARLTKSVKNELLRIATQGDG